MKKNTKQNFKKLYKMALFFGIKALYPNLHLFGETKQDYKDAHKQVRKYVKGLIDSKLK